MSESDQPTSGGNPPKQDRDYHSMSWSQQAQERLRARMEGRDRPLTSGVVEVPHTEGRLGISGAFTDAVQQGRLEAGVRLAKIAGRKQEKSPLELQLEGPTGAMMEELMGSTGRITEPVRRRAPEVVGVQRRSRTPEEISEARERIIAAMEKARHEGELERQKYGQILEKGRETERYPQRRGLLQRVLSFFGIREEQRA